VVGHRMLKEGERADERAARSWRIGGGTGATDVVAPIGTSITLAPMLPPGAAECSGALQACCRAGCCLAMGDCPCKERGDEDSGTWREVRAAATLFLASS